jgi:D,D-heptose 1,7-bisphosphate phosphatase
MLRCVKRFLLLDRDGTLIVHKHYLHRPEEVEFIPGAFEALRAIREAGWGIAVVSNQSGVGQGLFGEADVEAVHDFIRSELRLNHAEVDGFYWSPDHPDSFSLTRKPAPGLALVAAAEHGFDIHQCVVVGDNEADILLGNRLQVPTVLVQTGYALAGEGHPDFVIASIADLPAVLEAL